MSALTEIVLASLVGGLGLAVAGWLASGGIVAALKTAITDPNWNFSTSWASNVTVFGAILGTVLSASILPASTVVVSSQNGYTALSLLFGALVVVAPLIFTALRRGRPDPKGPVYTGRGWAFILASGVTLWGVLGELATIGLVLYEAHHANTIPAGGVVPMWIVVGTALVLVSMYGFETVRLTLTVPKTADFRLETAGGEPVLAAHGWNLL